MIYDDNDGDDGDDDEDKDDLKGRITGHIGKSQGWLYLNYLLSLVAVFS